MANVFCHLKRNHFARLFAESLKVELRTKQGMYDHCELLPVGKGSCYCVIAFQGMEWALIDEVDAESFDLLNITDDESESGFRTPVFDTDKVILIWSYETEGYVY